MTCPECEYQKNRAALWRAEAYRFAGHDVIERPWVGLTQTQVKLLFEGVQEEAVRTGESINWVFYTYINEALKEKNQ